MAWTGKLVGGVLGLVTLGPFGALLGVAVGHQFDEKGGAAPSGADPLLDDTEPLPPLGEHFFRTTFEVMGHLAKSDGRVSEQEIRAARGVMSELKLDDAQVRGAIDFFSRGKQSSFDLQRAVLRLRRACAGRPDLLRTFVEIQMRAALEGSDLTGPARALLQRIGTLFGFSPLELAHMEAILRIRRGAWGAAGAGAGANGRGAPPPRRGLDESQAYEILEVAPTVSDDELAKAYRRQLSRHHPDKLKANGLPDSMLEHAKQRTQQIIEAWELLRERRGIR